MRLSPHDGWPTINSTQFLTVESLSKAAETARNWWGIGLECRSDFVVDQLGNTDAAEVYFSMFRSSDRWALIYLESSRVADLRAASSEALQNLIRLQIGICETARIELSIYDEQDHNRTPVPTLREAEVAIRRAARNRRSSEVVVVVSSTSMSLARAQELADGSTADIREALSGHVVFPFM